MDKIDSLTKPILNIVKNKGTEPPSDEAHYECGSSGTYLCRQCGIALFRAKTKFHSGCGWPSFDEAIKENVRLAEDADGRRTEILCMRCGAHLGHVFTGEQFTAKNTRHCVNTMSLDFVSDDNILDTEEAIVAGGCFWGVEFLFNQLQGVLKTEVGYIGGIIDYPKYESICQGDTQYVEAVRIVYDPSIITYQSILKFFFEIHSFSQKNGQGPDIGEQYLSKIFYFNDQQKKIAEEIINFLQQKGYFVATELKKVSAFWRAEDYHQQYYVKNKKQPYCHRYEKKF